MYTSLSNLLINVRAHLYMQLYYVYVVGESKYNTHIFELITAKRSLFFKVLKHRVALFCLLILLHHGSWNLFER